MEQKDALALVEKHLQIWNEKGVSVRNLLLSEAYAPDIEMVDRHFTANGFAEIDGFINDLQQRNPSARFSPRQRVDTHHTVARLYWQFGEEGQKPLVTGMDVFVFKDSKVQKLYVFVD